MFTNGRVITPYRVIQNAGVIVEGSLITEVFQGSFDKQAGDTVIDVKNHYLSPGFIELHTHGAGGADFMDGTVDAVITGCKAHMESGTTSILPTTLTSTQEELFQNLENIGIAAQIPDLNMPNILGIHLEGPYFAKEQHGAQDVGYIKNPVVQEYLDIIEKFPMVRRWTVAPELPEALKMGAALSRKGVVMSIGHSNADEQAMENAVENGFSLVTHEFLGMSRLKRENSEFKLGVAEMALILDALSVEVIADGKHLPPNLIRLIYKMKGPEKICLVTDSIRAAGMIQGESIIGSLKNGQRVVVEDGVAYMPGKTSFGGSVATADRLIRTMVKQVGVPLHEAVMMMTTTPAKIMGVEHTIGMISPGKDADLLVFDEDINLKFIMNKGNMFKNRMD
ncbi:MAG: N-acetylglucosamine-6-phosphate deacetylase [Candidatus Cloacimonetes bacterium]|nr:N-acetylglucosamine-6-phosphate deacetylase [Candidatus Cloacimonadota bacterium]